MIVSKTKEETTGYIRADAMTYRPDEGDFIRGMCKRQVSAERLVVVRKTKWKTGEYVRPGESRRARIHDKIRYMPSAIISYNSLGPAEHDQGDKQRDTYWLKRRDAFVISSHFRCSMPIIISR